eukprot:4537281-Alexandrium_andersonii.AAC.1
MPFVALFHQVWRKAMFGPGQFHDEVLRFWLREREIHPQDPIFDISDESQFKLHIPFGCHGDDVRDTNDDKVCVVSWNSVLSRAAPVA